MDATEMKQIDQVPGGLDSVELNQLIEYVQGVASEPPAGLERLMTSIYSKMQTVSGYTVAAEVARQAKLSSFLSQIENELFDPDMLSTMSHEDLMDLHKRVSDENNRSQEATRRWLKENKDSFNVKKTEAEKIAEQISALSPEKLATVKKLLEGGSLTAAEDSFEEL